MAGRLTLAAASIESAKIFGDVSFLLIMRDLTTAFWTCWLGEALASMPGNGVSIVKSSCVCSEYKSVAARAWFCSVILLLSEVSAQARNERAGLITCGDGSHWLTAVVCLHRRAYRSLSRYDAHD